MSCSSQTSLSEESGAGLVEATAGRLAKPGRQVKIVVRGNGRSVAEVSGQMGQLRFGIFSRAIAAQEGGYGHAVSQVVQRGRPPAGVEDSAADA